MAKLKKYKYEIFIFIVEAVCMILEIVASRVLSPQFGSSNVVWTSVIAIILLSSSIGNYIGGKIADKTELAKKNLCITLFLASIFIFITAVMADDVVAGMGAIISNVKLGAILTTMLIFLIPSMFFGIIPPIVLRLKIPDLDNAGKTAGRINAISTIGGIFGTILGGFWLVPNIGSIQILYVLSLITMLLIFMVGEKISIKNKVLIILLMVVNVSLLFVTFNANLAQEAKVLRGDLGATVSYDTEYSRILIFNRMSSKGKVRVFNTDSGFETIMYIEDGKENEPYSTYIKTYDMMFNSKNEIKDVMMIGGAGYSYPRYFVTHFKDKTMDVVEIDPKVTKIAMKFFNLENVLNDKTINAKERLNLITDDGRIYLNKTNKKYDVIMNDAFTGNTPPKSLTTIEAVQNIKKSLNKDGIYVTNIIGSLDGKYSKFLKAEANTMKQVFDNIYVIPCYLADEETLDLNITRNNVVFATDQSLELDGIYELKIEGDEIILTDDFCPVDTLTDYDDF